MSTNKELRLKIYRTRLETYDEVIERISEALHTLQLSRAQVEQDIVAVELKPDTEENQ